MYLISGIIDLDFVFFPIDYFMEILTTYSQCS